MEPQEYSDMDHSKNYNRQWIPQQQSQQTGIDYNNTYYYHQNRQQQCQDYNSSYNGVNPRAFIYDEPEYESYQYNSAYQDQFTQPSQYEQEQIVIEQPTQFQIVEVDYDDIPDIYYNDDNVHNTQTQYYPEENINTHKIQHNALEIDHNINEQTINSNSQQHPKYADAPPISQQFNIGIFESAENESSSSSHLPATPSVSSDESEYCALPISDGDEYENTTSSSSSSEEYHPFGDAHFNEFISWQHGINGENESTPPPGYHYNKSIKHYNTITGGRFFEMEQKSKCKLSKQPISTTHGHYKSYLDDHSIDGNHKIFYTNDPVLYQHIFLYLDAKSIFNGMMCINKKFHYFKFIPEPTIWHQLICRDFPKLCDINLCVPYVDESDSESFEYNILSREYEKNLYFSKVQNDCFWKLLFNLRQMDLYSMTNEEIKEKWTNITWHQLLLGKDDDFGFGAYKMLNKLRYSSYVRYFEDVGLLPNDALIEYFCNVIRKHMSSGKAMFYLNPRVTKRIKIGWNKRRSWLSAFGNCWVLSGNDAFYQEEMKKIPDLIRLIASVQFQSGKGFKPQNDWLEFLQTFDPSIMHFSEVSDGWFQKQFMLNEMESRIKNIRNLIDIVKGS